MSDNINRGSTLDSLLEAEGVLQDYQARAIKEVIAWQISNEMKKTTCLNQDGRAYAYQPPTAGKSSES